MLLRREGGRRGRTGKEGEAVGREEGIPEGVGVGGRTEGGRNTGEPAGIAGGSEGKDVGNASFGESHDSVDLGFCFCSLLRGAPLIRKEA